MICPLFVASDLSALTSRQRGVMADREAGQLHAVNYTSKYISDQQYGRKYGRGHLGPACGISWPPPDAPCWIPRRSVPRIPIPSQRTTRQP